MTINGPVPPVPPAVYAPGSPAAPAAGSPPAGPTPEPVPSPPTGVTPELWSTLSAEEQAYFAQPTVRGPLTYGPTEAAATDSGALRGHRIDVRA